MTPIIIFRFTTTYYYVFQSIIDTHRATLARYQYHDQETRSVQAFPHHQLFGIALTNRPA